MAKCSKGTCRLRCKSEYTPKVAAASTISRMAPVTPAPSLFRLAASTMTEPLDLTRGGVASGDASWVVGASGRAIQRIGYRNNPTPVNRNTNEETTRMRVGLTWKYSAKPPQTPAIFLSVRERIKRFSPLTGAVAALAEGAGVGAGAAGILVDDDVAATRPESISRCRRFRSARSSDATWYRKSRSFSSNLLMMRSSSAGVAGFSETGATGALCRMLSKITALVEPGKGCFPVTIW